MGEYIEKPVLIDYQTISHDFVQSVNTGPQHMGRRKRVQVGLPILFILLIGWGSE